LSGGSGGFADFLLFFLLSGDITTTLLADAFWYWSDVIKYFATFFTSDFEASIVACFAT